MLLEILKNEGKKEKLKFEELSHTDTDQNKKLYSYETIFFFAFTEKIETPYLHKFVHNIITYSSNGISFTVLNVNLF